jgi:hypothetical protein
MKKIQIRNWLILFGLTIISISFTPQNSKLHTNYFDINTNQVHHQNTTVKVADDELCSIHNSSFKTGEELTYKAYYNWNFIWIAAGEITFKVIDQGDKYYINAKGRTYNSYDIFFKVRDEFQVWVDKETMLPTTSVREVREGGYQVYDMMKYDFDKMEIRSYRGKDKENTHQLVYDIDHCMHDILSIIYYIRNKDYDKIKAGTDIPIRVFLDKEKYSLAAKYVGEETKKIKDLGTYKTLKLMPEVISGEVFTDPSGMTIWATADKNRLPLQIESPLSVGSLKAVLKSHKNLRYPVTAKID